MKKIGRMVNRHWLPVRDKEEIRGARAVGTPRTSWVPKKTGCMANLRVRLTRERRKIRVPAVTRATIGVIETRATPTRAVLEII